MKKVLFIFSIFLFAFVLSPQRTLATTLLEEDFNDGSTQDNTPITWNEYSGPDGGWLVQEGEYSGTVVKNSSQDTFSYSLAGYSSLADYVVSVKVKGEQGIDKKLMIRYQSNGTRYDINLISGDGIYLQKWVNYSSRALWRTGYQNSNNQWYSISVRALGNNIQVFVNSQKLIDVYDETEPLLTGDVGLQIWPGYYNGYGSRTTTRYDDFVLESVLPSPLDTIILLPGLGASWNHEAMIMGDTRQPEDWQITPGVKVYDGIIQTLQEAGYEKGRNFFIFNYDWRKPVEEIANDLEEYLSRHPPDGGGKIDLVGHSLGGLVARVYLQENPENNVNQLITVGSPHQGSVKSYYLWEGADLSRGLSGWQKIGAGIILHLNKRDYENNVEALQRTIPSFKDTLPTFSYLSLSGVGEKSLSSMAERNTWLEDYNQIGLSSDFISKTKTIAGLRENTSRWIIVKERGKFDQLFGKWVDGAPFMEVVSQGDNTILVESAKLPGVSAIEMRNLNHGTLIESQEGQQKILELLGLSSATIHSAPTVDYNSGLVIQVASPANIDVLDPSGQLVEQGKKLIVVNQPIEGEYRVEVNPEGQGGNYRLLVGNITPSGDSWQEIDDQVSEGEQDSYSVNYSQDPKILNGNLISFALQKLIFTKSTLLSYELARNHPFINLVNSQITVTESLAKKLNTGPGTIQKELQVEILKLSRLQDQIKRLNASQEILTSKQEGEILQMLKEAQDYLLQAYEIN